MKKKEKEKIPFLLCKIKKTLRVMKWCMCFLLISMMQLRADVLAQHEVVSFNSKEMTLEEVFSTLIKQLNFEVFYNNEVLDVNEKVSLSAKRMRVDNLMKELLNDKFSYEILDKTIVITSKIIQQQQVGAVEVKGVVKDKSGEPLPGVNVMVKGTTLGMATDVEGRFSFTIPESDNIVILFSFIGMQTKEVVFKKGDVLNIVLEEDAEELSEVVITGLFERPKEGFTGSVSSFNKEEIKMIGGSNVLESLRTLDPSFRMIPNDQYGSDPNRLPDIDIRGKTSIVDPAMEYETNPNQPLFILDGFETTLQTVVDLDINRIASVTILKDAAASAMYGSKAANGVVVIETLRPQMGKIRLAYGGRYEVSMPDLSDYNMMNAREKLEYEVLARMYAFGNVSNNYYRNPVYNERLARVNSGVDTYWLNEPVRTGFTHRHNVYIDGGDGSLNYGLGLSYGKTEGVMKKSGNEVLNFNVELIYRTEKLRFSNKFEINNRETWNPPVSFDVFVETNPYHTKKFNGEIPKFLEDYASSGNVYLSDMQNSNPLYNWNLKYLNENKDFGFKNNFYAQWDAVDGLKFQGNLSLEKQESKYINFKSPLHTDYDEDKTIKSERGNYSKEATSIFNYNGDLRINYYSIFNDVHLITAVAGWDFRSRKVTSDRYVAIGFVDDNFDNPAFSNQFSPHTSPYYYELTKRETSLYFNGGYSYDRRYVFDVNYRRDGSYNFGVKNLFTNTWSTGFAWNIHREHFIGDWTTNFKLRFSVGNPGNNTVKYSTDSFYTYNLSSQNMFGNGLIVSEFGNPDLKWEKELKYNLGIDLEVFNGYLGFSSDIYRRIVDPLIVGIDMPSSTGQGKYLTNIGKNVVDGLDFNIAGFLIKSMENDMVWRFNLNGRTLKSKLSGFGNKLEKVNEKMRETSLQRYRDGASVDDIWAVRSKGIDPISGKEIMIKKDGSYTYDYDNNDEVVIGNSNPDIEGRFGTYFSYKGFSVNAAFHYIIGADVFNTVLYNKIENITSSDLLNKNQDKRALYDRWKKSGDIAKFRSVRDLRTNETNYPMTDRYLQRKNWFAGESISVAYDFRYHGWIQKSPLSSFTLRANMNDLFNISSIKQERGIAYPFARTVTFSLDLTF